MVYDLSSPKRKDIVDEGDEGELAAEEIEWESPLRDDADHLFEIGNNRKLRNCKVLACDNLPQIRAIINVV